MKIQYSQDGITIFESALYRTTTTIIVFGHSLLLVDPNWLPGEIDFIKEYIRHHYGGYEHFIVFTHADYDHIIGYGAFPSTNVIASAYFVSNPKKKAVIQQIQDFDDKYYITRSYPLIYPVVDNIIRDDGQILTIEGNDIHFYHAPGHTKEGLFILIPAKKCWIAGDYLSNIEIPMIDDNFEAYETTLLKAESLTHDYPIINLLITGHGDHTSQREDIKNRIQNDLRYLSMLRDRMVKNTDILRYEIKELIRNYSGNPAMQSIHESNIQKVKAELGG